MFITYDPCIYYLKHTASHGLIVFAPIVNTILVITIEDIVRVTTGPPIYIANSLKT